MRPSRLGGSGDLGTRRIWETVRAQILGLERCYADLVQAQPGLAGRVVVAFTIGPDGRVTRGRIRERGQGDPGLEACTMNFFRRLRVQPAPVGGPASFALALRFDPFALPERPAPEPARQGEFDEAIVSRTIRTRIRAIQRCYERQLRDDPTLAGRVVVRFTIVERGTVENVQTLENTTGNAAVAECVARAVARFRFNPGPEGGSVSYSYPFEFAPIGGAAE